MTDGKVQLACDQAQSKTTPPDEKESINGVVFRWYPYRLMWSARSVSTMITMTLGRFEAIGVVSGAGPQATVTAPVKPRAHIDSRCIGRM